MNTYPLLTNLIEDRHMNIRNSESAEYQTPLELSITKIYSYCLSHLPQLTFIEQKQIQPSLDYQAQLSLIEKIIISFIENNNSKNPIRCTQCTNYESYLQKLENDIRQHIRLEHQLKLYQESLEEKIQEMKKQDKQRMETLNQLKLQIQQYKSQSSKIERMEQETDRTRLQRNKSQHNFHKTDRTTLMRKSLKHFYQEGKQNVSVKNRSLSKPQSRKSIDKRAGKEKLRSTISTKPNRQAPLTEKVINRNQEEKKKAIQAKFVL